MEVSRNRIQPNTTVIYYPTRLTIKFVDADGMVVHASNGDDKYYLPNLDHHAVNHVLRIIADLNGLECRELETTNDAWRFRLVTPRSSKKD